MVAGGFWAAWLWEVPALLALGTDPEMQTLGIFPEPWRPCVCRAAEVEAGLQIWRMSKGHQRECLLLAFAWFLMPAKENWGTSGWKHLDGIFIKPMGKLRARGPARQRLDKNLGFHSSGLQEESGLVSLTCSGLLHIWGQVWTPTIDFLA